MKWGAGPDSNRNPNAPFLRDILKCVQGTPKPLPLYAELPMDRYRTDTETFPEKPTTVSHSLGGRQETS